MLTRRRFSLYAVVVLPLLLILPCEAAIIWTGPDAPPGHAIDWAENYAQQTSATDPTKANQQWYGDSHTRWVGPCAAGTSGNLQVPKYVASSPEFTLQAVILTLDGNSSAGCHILQNETATMGPSVTASLGAEVLVTSQTSLSQLSVFADPLTSEGSALMPCVGSGTIPDPATDPNGFLVYMSSDEPDDEKIVVTLDPPIAFFDSDAAGAPANLSEWDAAGRIGSVVVLDFTSTAIATATHTTNNVETIAYPPQLDFLVNVTYVYVAPEPLSLAVLGAGSLPLLAWRKRRRSAA